jgi:hypothetical protein
MADEASGYDTSNDYIGVDLDGTLAFWDGWKGVEHIGAPVPAMLKRVKDWLKEGRKVVIFTARLSRPKDAKDAREYIREWSLKHIGVDLPATCVKHEGMAEFWDDRCVQVKQNTGNRVGKQKIVTNP